MTQYLDNLFYTSNPETLQCPDVCLRPDLRKPQSGQSAGNSPTSRQLQSTMHIGSLPGPKFCTQRTHRYTSLLPLFCLSVLSGQSAHHVCVKIRSFNRTILLKDLSFLEPPRKLLLLSDLISQFWSKIQHNGAKSYCADRSPVWINCFHMYGHHTCLLKKIIIFSWPHQIPIVGSGRAHFQRQLRPCVSGQPNF